jgi:pantoate--beta-alanine ligase
MRVFHDISSLQQYLAPERSHRRVAFVPTMGALHRGHGACLEIARSVPDALAVCSVFVNPAQFAPGEDFERYPRTLDSDRDLLRSWNCDALFAPAREIMYSEPQRVWVDVEGLSEPLCGRFRPGHFRGVATVVAKLFHIVRPDVAVFGQKDAQQALIVRALVGQLMPGIELRLARTVREPDGLAVSSRNTYLGARERKQAAALFAALAAAGKELQSAERDARRIEAVAMETLRRASIERIDYVELRRADDLSALEAVNGRVILAIAAYAGATRLIDNMVFEVRDDAVLVDTMLY